MPFASIHFIFLFFPVTFLLYYCFPRRNWQNIILILASLFFFSWVDPAHLPVLLALILINYLFGHLIGSFQERNNLKAARFQMWTAVIINILILCFYKYLGFFSNSLQALTSAPLNIPQLAAPLGISYITFSAISYVMDNHNGVIRPEKNLLRFSAYLVMFPKLVQGPITRFKDVKNDLLTSHHISENLLEGVRRFIIGLAKKVILADSLAIVANSIFDSDYTQIGAGVAWYGLIALTLQIYFDFSGYTDMAIGLGKIFGFSLPENFNYPYISRSITDFWRRWHMSLTSWFRTYLFIPLEFARKREKHLRQQTNIMIVFLLTGLWHGASWNYVIWGGYFGLILAVEASGLSTLIKKAPRSIQHIYSLALIMLGWIFFRITNPQDWGTFLSALFGANGWENITTLRTLNIAGYLPIIILAIIFSTPVSEIIEKKFELKHGFPRLVADVVLFGVFVLVIGYILAYGFSPFMYAQF